MMTKCRYFMASSGLMAAVMTLNFKERSSADCSGAAEQWEAEKEYFNDYDMTSHLDWIEIAFFKRKKASKKPFLPSYGADCFSGIFLQKAGSYT